MNASNRDILQSVLAADYDGVVRRLTRKFGSSDFARETLHETFVRLENVSDSATLISPKDYLFRTALNVGMNRLRHERRRATATEIDDVLNFADDTPDPATIAEARSDIQAAMRAIGGLPQRTQRAFRLALFEDRPYAQIAVELDVSVRTVERDIQLALEHCASALAGQR